MWCWRCVRDSGEGLRRKEADRLGHGRLEEASMGRVGTSVCREHLSHSEESGKESDDRVSVWWTETTLNCVLVLEAYIIAAQTPSKVVRTEGIIERKDAPYQRIIHSTYMINTSHPQRVGRRMAYTLT